MMYLNRRVFVMCSSAYHTASEKGAVLKEKDLLQSFLKKICSRSKKKNIRKFRVEPFSRGDVKQF